jgi:hypothetical protein
MTKDANPRVVLTLVVKNEEKIIRRCLDAAGLHIDGLVVSCNGTDATKKIAKAWALEHELPHFILSDPWKNFAHNRSRAAQFTKKFVKEKFWPLKQTYMLLLDADMVFRLPTVWPSLTDFGYRLMQRGTDGLLWPNTRLCRLDHQWDCVGVTHEYWRPSPDPRRDPVTLDSNVVWIDDIGDGGSKADKFERDIALLTQGLIDEPNNERYWFYLAESLFNSGKHAESIPKYEKRRTMGGYHEEVWYSLYKIGQAHLSTGALDLGTHALLQAFQEKPGRAEPLVKLAQHFRERGQNHLALMMARYVRDTPVPAGGLFVESQMYSQALEEIAICAFYTGNHEEGREAGEELLARRDVPHPRVENAAKCVSFYVKPLAPHAIRQGQFSVHEEIRKFPGKFFGLEEPNQTEYLPSNPTIVEHQGRTLVNVRLVNYYHERGRVFAPKDPDGVVRTRNVLLEGWSPETGEHGVEMEVHADIPAEWDHTTRVRGLEDQRWCSFGEQVWLTATCFNIPGAGGMPRVVLGRVNSGEDDILSVVDVVELKYAGSRHYEKNWLPWNKGDGVFRVIYGYEPFTVLLVDTKTGECTVESQTTPEWNCSRWRGSCAPVRIGVSDRWLAMIHETAWFEGEHDADKRTVYMHRFIELEGDRIIRRSQLFTFDHSGVEYAAGLLWHHLRPTATTVGGPQVIVTHSVEESSARWKVFDWYLISAMLNGELP